MKLSTKLANILFVISLFSSISYARSLDDIKESGEIIMAVYENFPPYSYEEDGVAKGIDIDIATKIAKKIGVKPIWYWTGSDENLADDLRNVIWKGSLVHKTKADVMFRVPFDYDYMRVRDSVTGELETDLVVIKSPYQSERWVVATNKKSIPKVENLAIFRYNTIGVEIDTLPDSYLSSSFRGALSQNVKHYMSIYDAIEDLKSGKIDAVCGLKSQLEFGLEFYKNSDIYYISEPLKYVKSKWDLGVAVRTDFRGLSYEVDGIISDMYQKGMIKDIFEKYNVRYEKPLAYNQ